MVNSESTVALLTSKHRIFMNTSCVFKIKRDFTIDRASFCYHKKVIYRYVIIIKVKFIDRINTKELVNGKILFLFCNPAGDQEKSSVAYCSNKNHNFANIGHKNMNDASF